MQYRHIWHWLIKAMCICVYVQNFAHNMSDHDNGAIYYIAELPNQFFCTHRHTHTHIHAHTRRYTHLQNETDMEGVHNCSQCLKAKMDLHVEFLRCVWPPHKTHSFGELLIGVSDGFLRLGNSVDLKKGSRNIFPKIFSRYLFGSIFWRAWLSNVGTALFNGHYHHPSFGPADLAAMGRQVGAGRTAKKISQVKFLRG
jgi:hypothetical protein